MVPCYHILCSDKVLTYYIIYVDAGFPGNNFNNSPVKRDIKKKEKKKKERESLTLFQSLIKKQFVIF